jgi:hypothetical protein
MGIVITDLSAALKERALSTREILLTQLMVDRLEIAPHANTVDPMLLDEQPILRADLTEISQKGKTGAFAPKGTTSFKNRILKRRQIKADITITDKQIRAMEASYLGMIRGKGVNPQDFPFAAFVLDLHLRKAAAESNNVIFSGVYDSDEAVTTAASTLDGLTTKVYADLTASVIPSGNAFVHGAAITAANAGDVLHGLMDLVVAVPGGNGTVWKYFVDPVVARNYQKWYRTEYNIQQGINSQNITFVDGDANHVLVPVEGLRGTGKVMSTRTENLFYLFDDSNFNIDVMLRERSLSLMLDWALGVEYGNPNEVFATVLD